MDDPGYEHNPLFMKNGHQFLAERQSMLEHSIGAKGIKTFWGYAFDKNYAAKQKEKTNVNSKE